ATDGSRDAFVAFLRDHVRLFHQLRRWTVVAVGLTGWTALAPAFERCLAGATTGPSPRAADLHWYFERRRTLEEGNLAQIPVGDLRRFRQLQQEVAGEDHGALYTV